jgi:hypothetical protein
VLSLCAADGGEGEKGNPMRRFIFAIFLLLLALPLQAQDAQDLPSELYILRNEGFVERYGLGSEGVRQVSPEGEFVLDFRVAPDSRWLAYRTQAGLFLKDMYGETIRPLEDNRAGIPFIRGRGETMAWSPDGNVIVYTTEYGARVHFLAENSFADLPTPGLFHLQWSPEGQFLAAEAEQGVWWIYQRNGAEIILRAAIPGSNGGDWLSETQFLYAPIEGGLTILDFNGGNLQYPLLDASRNYFMPSVTDDGTVVAFAGSREIALLVQVDITASPVTAFEIGTTMLDLTSMRWASGGFLLTAFQGGVIALVNPLTGGGFTLPITSASAYSWGESYPPLIVNIPLPSPAYFLSRDLTGVQQLWILPADGSPAYTLTTAAMDISEFAVSPNGQRIAYISNSSIWRFDVGSLEAPVEWVQLGINEGVTPAWGPDNATLYYRDVQNAGSGIWRISDSAEASLFVPDDGETLMTHPQPALGIGALLIQSGSEAALVDTTTGEVRLLGIIGSGRWHTGTSLIVQGQEINSAGNGLYALDANQADQAPSLILPLLGSLQLLDYRIMENGSLRLLVQNSNPGEILVLDAALDGSQPTLINTLGYLSNPRLSTDGATVIGQRNPTGVLLLVDVATGTRQQIAIQTLRAPIFGFVWP